MDLISPAPFLTAQTVALPIYEPTTIVLVPTAAHEDTSPNAASPEFKSLVALTEKLISSFSAMLTKSLEVFEKVLADKHAASKTGSSSATSEETASKNGGEQDFLWKPVSEKDGKLVVLLPSALTGNVASITIKSAKTNKVLATGRYSGLGNGGREHYRFTRPGKSYPDKSIVSIALNEGETITYTIPDTAKRYSKKS
jgi:hypothetical protein